MRPDRSAIALALLLAIGVAGCEGTTKAVSYGVILLTKGTEVAERARRNDASDLPGMSLEVMFPDASAQMLAKAAGKGRVKAMERLVTEGVDVNSLGAKNVTPLWWAFRKHSLKGFRKLLELGADPNVVFLPEGWDGTSMMHWAAQVKDIRYLQVLLEHGGNPDLRAGRWEYPVIFETFESHWSWSGWNLSWRRDTLRQHRELLLEHGADIDAAARASDGPLKSEGQTALTRAAIADKWDVVYELLEMGADFRRTGGETGANLMCEIGRAWGIWNYNKQQSSDRQRVIDWLAERGVASFPDDCPWPPL